MTPSRLQGFVDLWAGKGCYEAEMAADLRAVVEEAVGEKVARYDLALQSLTPGGSEYVGDPERCVQFVKDTRQMQHETIVKAVKERKAAEAERDGMRGRLDEVNAIFGEIALNIQANAKTGVNLHDLMCLSKIEEWKKKYQATAPAPSSGEQP